MHIIIWEYQVKPKSQPKFETIYSPEGAWARLFNKSRGYMGTELLRDVTDPQRYLTIDRWDSKEAFKEFLSQWEYEYNSLDALCEGLADSESPLGRWESTK